MVCFLAYVMEMAIRQALGKGVAASEGDYHAVMQDLRRVGAGVVVSRRGRYVMRTPLTGRAHEAFAAVGMRVPSRVLEGPGQGAGPTAGDGP